MKYDLTDNRTPTNIARTRVILEREIPGDIRFGGGFRFFEQQWKEITPAFGIEYSPYHPLHDSQAIILNPIAAINIEEVNFSRLRELHDICDDISSFSNMANSMVTKMAFLRNPTHHRVKFLVEAPDQRESHSIHIAPGVNHDFEIRELLPRPQQIPRRRGRGVIGPFTIFSGDILSLGNRPPRSPNRFIDYIPSHEEVAHLMKVFFDIAGQAYKTGHSSVEVVNPPQ